MFNWGPFLTVLFVLFGLSLLVAGLVLLKRGLWPRRKGTDPHCRHCEYNLTGLQEGICPECGKSWTPATAARGHRQRQPGQTIGGSLVLLAACMWFTIPVANRIGNVNYFGLLPTRAVLLFADTSGSATAQKAIDEMASRLKAGTVSADQAEQFFRKIAKFDLKIRERVIEGEQVPYEVQPAIPRVNGVFLKMGFATLEVDQQAIHQQHMSFGTMLDGWASGFGSKFSCLPAGQHTVKADYRVRFTWTGSGGLRGVCEYKIPLQGQFEVIPADSQDTVKVVRDAGLKEQLQRCIHIERSVPQTGLRTPRLSVTVVAYNSPMDLAFDIFARVQGQEYKLSSAIFRKNGNYGYQCDGDYTGPMTQTADIILRSNPKVARETVDFEEIWEGELVFPNAPVMILGSAASIASQPVGVPMSEVDPSASEDEQAETR